VAPTEVKKEVGFFFRTKEKKLKVCLSAATELVEESFLSG